MRLDTVLSTYVNYRKALGERFRTNAQILKSFCRTIGGETEIENIQSEQVRVFLNGTGPVTASWHIRFNALEGFYRYATSHGIVRTSPMPTVKPERPEPFVPYIYTHEELRRLLAATLSYQKNRGHLEPYMVQTLLLTLYGAGLRVSEALSLRMVDVDLQHAVLTIHDSKFFTSRLVPIGTQLNEKLLQYATRRREAGHAQNADAPFFVKRNGQSVSIWNMEDAFQLIREKAGICRTDGASYQPRLHDFRYPNLNKIQTFFKDA